MADIIISLFHRGEGGTQRPDCRVQVRCSVLMCVFKALRAGFLKYLLRRFYLSITMKHTAAKPSSYPFWSRRRILQSSSRNNRRFRQRDRQTDRNHMAWGRRTQRPDRRACAWSKKPSQDVSGHITVCLRKINWATVSGMVWREGEGILESRLEDVDISAFQILTRMQITTGLTKMHWFRKSGLGQRVSVPN